MQKLNAKKIVHTINYLVKSDSLNVRFILGALFACLVSFIFFSPRLEVMMAFDPKTFEFGRATTYLMQCEDPWRTDIQRAMRWRLLPPAICHYLGLSGKTPLLLPWIGWLLMVLYISRIFQKQIRNHYNAYLSTALIATASVSLVSVHWFGMNDSWVWLALLTVAFSPKLYLLIMAALLAPWVDERFILGLPVALCTTYLQNQDIKDLFRKALWIAACLAPYICLRLWAMFCWEADPSNDHLVYHIKIFTTWASHAPLGWWMGWRLCWLFIIYVLFQSFQKYQFRVAVFHSNITLYTLLLFLILAIDVSRSTGILIPFAILGLILFDQRSEAVSTKALALILAAQLLIPSAHVVGTNIVPILPLPIEIIRILS